MVIQNHTRRLSFHLIAIVMAIVATEKSVGRAKADLPK